MELKTKELDCEVVNKHLKLTPVKFYVPELEAGDDPRKFFILPNHKTFSDYISAVIAFMKGKRKVTIEMSGSFEKHFFKQAPAFIGLPEMSFVKYELANGLTSDTEILKFSRNFDQKVWSPMESRTRILWIIANMTRDPKIIGPYYSIVDYYFCEDLTLRAVVVSYSRIRSVVYCDCSPLDREDDPQWSSKNSVFYEI